MRGALREASVVAVFAAVALAFTWPLVLDPGTSAADSGSTFANASVLDWVCHALTSSPLRLFEPPYFHGGIHPLAYGEHLTGIALFVLPLHLAGAGAMALHNAALLLGIVFSAYGAFVLARMVTRSTPVALVTGILFAFASYPISNLEHLPAVWAGWLPLLLAAFLAYWRKPTWRRAAAFGAALTMTGLTSIHWLLLGTTAVAATALLLAVREPQRPRGAWLRLAAATCLAGLALLPFLLPYQRVAEEYDARRTTSEVRDASASWTDWLVPSSRNRLYGRGSDQSLHRTGRELFPGVILLFFAAWLWVTRERRDTRETRAPVSPPGLRDLLLVGALALTWYATVAERVTIGRFSFTGADVPAVLTLALASWRFAPQLREKVRSSRFSGEEQAGLLWLVLGMLASLGWNAFVHPFLFRVVTPFRATRTPAAWAVVALAGLVILASAGMARFLSRRSGRARPALAGLLVFLALLETVPRVKWIAVDPEPAPVYRWLATERPGVVLELPLTRERAAEAYMLASTHHRVPLINGHSGWETPLHKLLRRKEDALAYDAEFLEAIGRAGGTTVVVHEAALAPEQSAALALLLSRLQPLARFGSDAVYALPR